MADNTRDIWRIDETQDGWTLVVQPRISWRWLVPRTLPEWLGLGAFLFLAYLAFPGFVLAGDAWRLEHLFLTLVVLLCIFGVYVTALWFIYLPPTFSQALRAQRAIEVRFGPSSFESEEGVFQNSCLSTLRLEPIQRLDRFTIVFTGTALKEAPLIDWPGLPEERAKEIIAAIAQRAGLGIS